MYHALNLKIPYLKIMPIALIFKNHNSYLLIIIKKIIDGYFVFLKKNILKPT